MKKKAAIIITLNNGQGSIFRRQLSQQSFSSLGKGGKKEDAALAILGLKVQTLSLPFCGMVYGNVAKPLSCEKIIGKVRQVSASIIMWVNSAKLPKAIGQKKRMEKRENGIKNEFS